MQELEILRDAGLTVYQSKAYVALKSQSGLSPIEIVRRSGVPQSKIHETLYSLEGLGLVKRHFDKEGAIEIDRKINEFLVLRATFPVVDFAFDQRGCVHVYACYALLEE